MTSEFPPSDMALLAEIRGSAEAFDPVPKTVIAAAKASLTWRSIDAELAQLIEDSALAPMAGVRSAEGPRLLTFESAETTLVLEVLPTGPTRRVLGQLLAAPRARVEVRHARGADEVEADELGRFRVEEVPAGPLSLACTLAEPATRSVVTSWVTI